MKVQLESIESLDARRTAELTRGEVVAHDVTLTINDGTPRVFQVYLTAHVLPRIDASLLTADPLLQELLRFQPESLNRLLAVVGRFRRGESSALPMLILDASEEAA